MLAFLRHRLHSARGLGFTPVACVAETQSHTWGVGAPFQLFALHKLGKSI
jgi:hypothetical protein